MTNKITDIPLKLVVVERNYGCWKEFRVATTPVNTEALLGPIYQLKVGAALHRMCVKNRAVIAKVLVGEDNIVVKESEEVVEYVSKSDLEPYELSEYDEERLAEYNKRIKSKNIFDTMIMPSVKAIAEEYGVNWAKDKKNIYLVDKGVYRNDYRKSDHKERHKEITDKLKALGCKVIIPSYGEDICRININQSAANIGLV